jgi:uncharacterized protein DUF4337
MAGPTGADKLTRDDHATIPGRWFPMFYRRGDVPEEIELDSDKLRETIDKEIEHENSDFLKRIALSTALFAAFAAVVAMQAGDTVNEALVLKTEATRLQAQASDQWAFYQAKGIKASVADAGAQSWLSIGKPTPAALTDRVAKETNDQKEIRQKAEELEHERDAKSAEADRLLQRHHLLANAVALLQVSIALGAVAALTRRNVMWLGSLLVGSIGVVLFAVQLLR